MTRSDPKPAAPAKPAAQKSGAGAGDWTSGAALPANLPDPAVLARMATEFFTALPGFSQSAGNVPASDAPPLPDASDAAPAAAPVNASALTEADFIDSISGLGESSAPLSTSVPLFQPSIPAAQMPEFPGQMGCAGL